MNSLDNRIIGEFLEINADIVLFQHESKLPGFIKKSWAQWKRNKLKKMVNKLRKSDHILTLENLAELFVYLYNNYPPNGSYECIKLCKVLGDNSNQMEAIIKFADYNCVISIDKKDPEFDIAVKRTSSDGSQGFKIKTDKLYCKNRLVFATQLKEINECLKDVICKYIISILDSYK